MVFLSCVLKLTKILDIHFCKFWNISIKFEDTKMVDHTLKISRPGVFDKRCLNWNTAITVFMNKYHMVRRRYRSRHVYWDTMNIKQLNFWRNKPTLQERGIPMTQFTMVFLKPFVGAKIIYHRIDIVVFWWI